MKFTILLFATVGLLFISPSNIEAQKRKKPAGSRQKVNHPQPPRKEAATPQVQTPAPTKTVIEKEAAAPQVETPTPAKTVVKVEPNHLDRLRGEWDLEARYEEERPVTVSRTDSGFTFFGGGTTVVKIKDWELNKPRLDVVTFKYGLDDHVITLKYDAKTKNYLLTAKADKVANLPNDFPLAYSDKEGFMPQAPLPQTDHKSAAQASEEPVKPTAQTSERSINDIIANFIQSPVDPNFRPKIVFNEAGGHTWFIAPKYKIEFTKINVKDGDVRIIHGGYRKDEADAKRIADKLGKIGRTAVLVGVSGDTISLRNAGRIYYFSPEDENQAKEIAEMVSDVVKVVPIKSPNKSSVRRFSLWVIGDR